MLSVYIDNHAISASPEACRTLSDLLAWVTRENLPDGRIVEKLLVNGRNYYTLNREYLEFVLTDPEEFRQMQTVEITSTPASDLARESIVGAIDYIDGLLMGLQNIAQKLRAGQIQEGFHFYAAALKGIGSIIELMTTLEPVLKADYRRMVLNGVSVRDSLDSIAPKVKELVEAQERNDLITMADLLEYDIHDTLGHWKLVLHEVARGAQAGQDSAHGNSPLLGGQQIPAAAPRKVL